MPQDTHAAEAAPCPAAQSGDPLVKSSAVALAALIASGQASAREVMTAHLQRIAQTEGRIHAFAHLDPDRALQAAAAADERQAAGEPLGPLHGVPVTIKDWIEVEGLPCDGGFVEREGFRPRRHATAAARMLAAGAVLIGKTVTRDGAPMYPRPANPHDLTRAPGASSSGEAAAIAAGCSPLGLGSDSGGSIRLPAHYSGVAGLKPTQGRVSAAGHFPPIGALSDPRTTIGPLARSVADLELALQVIAGPDGRDPAVQPMPLAASANVDPAGLRIAVVDFAGHGVDAATIAAVHLAGRIAEAAGARIETAELPILEESLAVSHVHWAQQRSLSLSRWTPDGRGGLPGAQIDEGLFRWERLQRQVLAFMGEHDAILCPAAATAAPIHRPLTAEDYLFTLPFSLTGQPVAVVPLATSDEGLPIGAQVVAARWRDDVALKIAALLEVGR
ncbi:MAG TPA: amidase [Caulobacteraceae bacterium]|nr:amidase [Caulobacteraceae bacterium]